MLRYVDTRRLITERNKQYELISIMVYCLKRILSVLIHVRGYNVQHCTDRVALLCRRRRVELVRGDILCRTVDENAGRTIAGEVCIVAAIGFRK